MKPTPAYILWLLRVFARPLPDVALERMLAPVPPSTVRSWRLNLVRAGAIVKAGECGSGRSTRSLWKIR